MDHGDAGSAPASELLRARRLREIMFAYREALHAHARRLNDLNVYPVPDGDTGTNMARTLDAVADELGEVELDDLSGAIKAVCSGSLMGARGNSGIILSQFLRGLFGVLEQSGGGSAASMARGLVAGAGAARRAVLEPVEGTILTVTREAATAADIAASARRSLLDVVEAARVAGQEALDRTPELLPVLREAGVVDAGGAGFLLLLDAALHVLDGRPLPRPSDSGGAGPAAGEAPVGGPRYEVMFLLDLPDELIDGFRSAWGELGESIAVVGGEGRWSCHIHTDTIGAAVETALDRGGRPSRIQVTDLILQVGEGRHDDEPPEPALPEGRTGVVAVAAGDGQRALFASLGALVVEGGQTMNPSTAELLAAVERWPADEVVVLPNNGNIVPVAEQLDGLSAKRVVVVPTRSAVGGLCALVAFRADADVDHNVVAMVEAAGAVRTGEVTRAVRATGSDVGPISEGDWIGLVRGDGIVAVEASADAAARSLLEHLIDPSTELVTVLSGADATAPTLDALTEWLAFEHPELELEVHHGGQPHYPFVVGVE